MSDLDDVVAALRALYDAEWEKYLASDDEYRHGLVDGVSAAVSCVQAMIRQRKGMR